MNIFGFEIKKSKPIQQVDTPITPGIEDGGAVITSGSAYYGQYVLDLDGIFKNENDLIRRYREIAQYPDCDSAIEDIVTESIIAEENKPSISINTDELPFSSSIKNKFQEEFKYIYNLLDFDKKGHDIFRSWYVDGRLYYHIITAKDLKQGIAELRKVDPRKIKRIKEVQKQQTIRGIEIVKNQQEYFLYSDKGFTESTTDGIPLSKDSVVYVPSGVMDETSGLMCGYLHKAIKPVNQLKMVEDSLVIYRLSRAPERRIFYIDVGNLPKLKAEAYVHELMSKYRNKITYDASTGEVRDDRKHMSIMEDFWMPRRTTAGGGKGTEITTLPGGQNLANIEDINYFQNKLYQSLNVPISRLRPADGLNFGKASEITRDEVKFSKFIGRIRNKFVKLFKEILRVQLIIKNVISVEEWEKINPLIHFNFSQDNYFSEFKENEILGQRLQMMGQIQPYIGTYFSQSWVKKNIFRFTEEEQEQMDKEIAEEPPPVMVQGGPDMGQPVEQGV